MQLIASYYMVSNYYMVSYYYMADALSFALIQLCTCSILAFTAVAMFSTAIPIFASAIDVSLCA